MSSRSSEAQNDELVEDRGEGGELGSEVGDNQSINEEEGEGSGKGSVDDTLEENADKLNLTAINVKSILHVSSLCGVRRNRVEHRLYNE